MRTGGGGPPGSNGHESAAVDPYVRFNRRFFARWAPFYDGFALSIAWVYRAAARQIAPRPGMTVLDVCTGTGEIARRCAAAGAAVTGVDLSPEMLDRARRKMAARDLPATIALMDARHLDFADGSFDVVVVGFGLHDMPPRVRPQVLAEMRRVARRRLIVADYDFSPDRPGAALWRWAIGLVETPYFVSFADGGAGPLLADAGWHVVSERRVSPAFAVFEARAEDGGLQGCSSVSIPR